MVQLWLPSGANFEDKIPDISDTQGQSSWPPLILAVSKQFNGVVRFLLQEGVDPSYQFHQSSGFKVNGVYQSIPKTGKASALSTAVGLGNYNIAEALLHYGADSDCCHTSLLVAMEMNDAPLVALLLEKGIRNDWNLEKYGGVILLCAAFTGCTGVMQSLLDEGSDIDSRPTDIITLARRIRGARINLFILVEFDASTGLQI
ncbi:hypothetical protein BJX70DRAFT_362667 [Aspergillus crustosus]